MSRQRWARTIALTPGSSSCGGHDIFAPTALAQGDGDPEGDGAAVFAHGGTAELTNFYAGCAGHTSSWRTLLPRSSLHSEAIPSTRRRRWMTAASTSVLV